MSKADKTLGKKVELLRNEVERNYKKKMLQPLHHPEVDQSSLLMMDQSFGKFVESVNGGFARTGTGIENGIQLKKIMNQLKQVQFWNLEQILVCRVVIFKFKNNPYLHTIEGSSELCDIARSNLSEISQNFFVDNSMFDESIDPLIGEGKKFDLAFVDGQHEEKATLHYAYQNGS